MNSLTPDERFTIILTCIGLSFTIMTVLLSWVVAIVRSVMRKNSENIQRSTEVEMRLTDIAQDVHDMQEKMDKRVRFLEENMWKPKP